MLKKGQIEEKQYTKITSEIDQKVFQLKTRNPKIHMRDQKTLIKQESEFKKIFSQDQVEEIVKNLSDEVFLDHHQEVVKSDEKVSKVYYVARGRIEEKYGPKDSKNRALTYHKGQIALFHLMLPEMADQSAQSSVYSHEHGTASVIPIPVDKMREILMNDEQALTKFWHHNAYRMIFFNFAKCPNLRNHGQDAIKRLVKASQIFVFKNKLFDKKMFE